MCKKLFFLISLILLLILGSPSGAAYAGTVTATLQSSVANTDWAATPQDVTALSEGGDWRLWDNTVGAPAYKKNTSKELIGDLSLIGTFSLYNTGNDQNFSWSDGVNPASTSSTATGIGSNGGIADGTGYQVDVTLPGGAGNITLWTGTRACYGRLVILDGSTEVFSMNGGARNTVWGIDRFDLVAVGFSPGTVLTIEWVIAPGQSNGSGRAQFYGVALGGVNALPVAYNPNPKNKAVEIPKESITLSWSPGELANTHNVFFGADEDSVTNATTGNPLDTTVFEGLALEVNNVDIGTGEYGTTYYWRVDEVNIPSKPGIITGNVWKFTTELEGYPLEPAKIVNVTASENPVYPEDQEPNMTCNESGLDVNDMHSNVLATMWLGYSDDPGQVWIQYEFDKIYKLHDMLVWNYNELPPGYTYGARDVNIIYSEDGVTWKALGDTVVFNQATGEASCEANTAIDFDGAIAKYVKLTFWSSWEDGVYTGGVSEVRFSAMPTRSSTPVPANAAANIAVDAVLGWKAGRGVVEHHLYMGTDVNAVKEGTASKVVLQDVSYAPELQLAKTYYWKVDEVNMAEEYTTWDGDVWSFSTVQAIVVDNFEVGYDDSDANAVWNTWLDGYGNESVNGALTGYEFPGPYLSTTNVNGGHSAPIRYNNTTAGYSEIKAQSEDLPIGTVDWSLGSPRTLTIWFRGDPCNVVGDEELYCKIDGQRFVYAGDIAYLGRNKWMQWDIDLAGMNLSDVDDIAIGIKKTGAKGGSGVLLIDYIRLTGLDPTTVGESIWFEAETMTLTGSMRVSTTTTGFSGTGYIDAPTQTTPTEPNLASLATKTFTVTGGKYIINARAQDGFSLTTYLFLDSFWVRVINSSGTTAATDVTIQNPNGWINWDGAGWSTYGAWNWIRIWNTNTSNQNVTWTLPAGTYTIQFSYKETGNKLDIVEIVKVGD